ncbi:unnamed protein product [Linum trigynum]|uniref:Uncharacterized protein n=1 Tax=Linum trigynum TaxID=586398 RepID=A0AAV2DZW0_9ROSI
MASGDEDARLRRKSPEEGRFILDRRLKAEVMGSHWIGSSAPLTDLAANEEEGGGGSISLPIKGEPQSPLKRNPPEMEKERVGVEPPRAS